MDGDPAVESELDSFSLTFPLPYRVAVCIVFGIYLPFSQAQLLWLIMNRCLGMGRQLALSLKS